MRDHDRGVVAVAAVSLRAAYFFSRNEHSKSVCSVDYTSAGEVLFAAVAESADSRSVYSARIPVP